MTLIYFAGTFYILLIVVALDLKLHLLNHIVTYNLLWWILWYLHCKTLNVSLLRHVNSGVPLTGIQIPHYLNH
jgi:uncharacterized membrane protein (DUF106 family)